MLTSKLHVLNWLRTRPTVSTPRGDLYVRLEALDYDLFQIWFTLRLQKEIPPPPTLPATATRRQGDVYENARLFWSLCRWFPWLPQRRELTCYLQAETNWLTRADPSGKLQEAR